MQTYSNTSWVQNELSVSVIAEFWASFRSSKRENMDVGNLGFSFTIIISNKSDFHYVH